MVRIKKKQVNISSKVPSLSLEDEEIALEWELDRRMNNEKIRSFVPNGAQERYAIEFGKMNKRTIIFPAGNGVGKTTEAMVMLGMCIWPQFAGKPPFDSRPFMDWEGCGYVKRARIISTTNEIAEIGSIQIEIAKWWPKGRYSGEKAGKPYVSRYRTDTGWLIDIMTYEQDAKEFEGATISFFVFNEPPPKPIYNACTARMRFGGKVLLVMTPLYASAWVKDELVDQAEKLKCSVVYADIEENCKQHGKNGILDHTKIMEMIASYDADEIDARVHGKFMHLAGVIFSDFDRNVHVAKEPIVPPSSLDIEHIQIVDPHAGKPFAIIYAYSDPAGFLYIYDEWPRFEFATAKESKFTVQDYCRLFKSDEKFRMDIRILDRHFGNNRDLQSGLTLMEDFADRGIIFEDSYNCDEEVETGILKVKAYMRYDRSQPLSPINRPKMLISPTCTNTIRSVERWSRHPKTGKPNNDCWKDFCDDLRYLCVYQPIPVQGTSRPTVSHGATIQRNWDTSKPFD